MWRDAMRDYMESLGVGLAVGLVYGLLRFRSPAPPLIVLVGLLGMLLGEQLASRLRGPQAQRPSTESPQPKDPSVGP